MSTAIIAFRIDGAEFLAKSKALAAMPDKIRTTVLARGFRAVSRSSESKIVREVSAATSMRQKDVRSRLKTMHSDHDVTHVVRSKWIPLAQLGGARQTSKGVTVRGWGSHKGAFLIGKFGGNVYAREGKARLPIKKLFGPNPANHINTHPDRYRQIMEEEAERRLLPEVERQLDLALRGL